MPSPQILTDRAAKWLLRKPDPTAESRLFCFPYPGCGASMYNRWPRRIGQTELCFVQPPGRENRIRDPHYSSYEQFAASLVEFLPPYLDKPFAFIGHCGGVLPAVELTHQLREAALPLPTRLFVSSQVAPHDGPKSRLLDLDSEQLGAELALLITSLGGTPSPGLIEMGVELLEKDIAAVRRYQAPGPRPLPCGVTVIEWTRDDEYPAAAMSGWRDLSTDCRYVTVEGGHYEFLGCPAALVTEIERDLP